MCVCVCVCVCICDRFKDYDGSLLSELVSMQQRAPGAVYNALIKENFSLTDVVKLNRAMSYLPSTLPTVIFPD